MKNKNDKPLSTSPQITTKVSEHGDQTQMSNLMENKAEIDNLANTCEHCNHDANVQSSVNTYAPKERTDYNPSNAQLNNFYESTTPTRATSPVTDDIAVNNIITSEFDNTEDLTDPPPKKEK